MPLEEMIGKQYRTFLEAGQFSDAVHLKEGHIARVRAGRDIERINYFHALFSEIDRQTFDLMERGKQGREEDKRAQKVRDISQSLRELRVKMAELRIRTARVKELDFPLIL